MAASEAITALPTGGDADPAVLRNFLVKRVIYPLGDAEDPEAFVALDPDTGAIPQALSWHSIIFWLDPDDSTTAHDGTTVLVTDDGYRYKIPEYEALVRSVLDKDLTAPPGLPAFGDAYLVPAGATGDWAGQNDKITIWTARGWKFITPQIGRILHVEDEDAYYHYNAAGAWVAGFGATLLSSGSVLPANILAGRSSWVVENQTTDAPPAVADGTCYIIGPAPSGVWTGHAAKLAMARAASTDGWIIIAPTEGVQAYDKALNRLYTYNGATWALTPSGLRLIESKTIASVASLDFTTGLDDTYDHYLLKVWATVSTNAMQPYLRVGTGPGPTWQATGYVNTPDSSGIGALICPGAAGAGVPNAAGSKFFCAVRFDNPESTSLYHMFRSEWGIVVSGSLSASISSGMYNALGAITGVRLFASAGTFVTGRASLYGMSKA